MKKKIIIIIIVLLILLIPIKFSYMDGGTIEYRSLTYRIIKWHRLDDHYDSGYKTGTEVYYFPHNFREIDYYEEVKPPRFKLIYNDEIYPSEIGSYCWHNKYKSVCADTLGPLDINYKKVIEASKNDTMNYLEAIQITSIELYDENGVIDYQVEYDNAKEIITIPNLTGTYIMYIYYKCAEGSVNYYFKLNIK